MRFPCPHCDARLSPGNLLRHKIKVHSKPKKRSVLSENTSSIGRLRAINPADLIGPTASSPAPAGQSTYKFCSCEGSNDNCNRCFGTGKIEIAPTKPSRSGRKKFTGTFSSRVIKSPLLSLPPLEADSNIKGIYRTKRAKKVIIRPDKKFATLADEYVMPEEKILVGIKEEWVGCVKCKVRVRGDRILRHVRRTHEKIRVASNIPQASKRGSTKLVDDERYEHPQSVRKMDHTRLYAHAFREEGRYGSHPSHDGFDDESKP